MNRSLILVIHFFIVSSVSAQLSPGDLSTPHQHLEGLTNCTKCHEIGEKLLPEKCLDCHKLLDERIKAGKGLHAGKEYENCFECHSDHQGKKFDLIWWKEGRDNFDHTKTGYPLQGKHQTLDCKKCHNSDNISDKKKYTSQNKNLDRTFLGLDTTCNSCHFDEHRGQLDIQCLKCHDYNAWKPAPLFDHTKTRYSLSGKHITVDCVRCHKNLEDNSGNKDQNYLKFTGLVFANCRDCHRDPHEGRLGSLCTKCHTVNGWNKVINQDFNHDLTRFPLIGKHRGIACDKCHRANQSLTSLRSRRCQNCHKDYHQGQFYHRSQKGACEECHTAEGFQPASFTVEQHNLTNYPLEGAHLAVPCHFCHPKNKNNTMQFYFSSTECQICHRDPHKQEAQKYLTDREIPEGKNLCQYCHSVTSWAEIEFDHNQTTFRLDGKHQSLSCKSCHFSLEANNDKAVNLKLNKKACQDCHRDVHMGQFDSENDTESDQVHKIVCDKCHNTLNWTASIFDHNRDSRFKLEGAHKGLNCSKCHKTIDKNGKSFVHYKPLDTSCSACHADRSIGF